jgi:hypothetical protein
MMFSKLRHFKNIISQIRMNKKNIIIIKFLKLKALKELIKYLINKRNYVKILKIKKQRKIWNLYYGT